MKLMLNDRRYAPYIYRFCVVVMVVLLALVMVHLRLTNLRDQVTLQISEQQTLLVSIAEVTARNGADSVTETVIKDCSIEERTDFDELLGRLDKGLSTSELTKLERLFGRCGSFYAERKSLMVARMSREIEVYVTYVEQLETLTKRSEAETYHVETWKRLAEEEKKQSELFSALVDKQDTIINTLLSGKRADSVEMVKILGEAREVHEELFMTNRQAAATRAELIPL